MSAGTVIVLGARGAITWGPQVGARFLASLAAELEEQRGRADSGLACTNLVMVAVHCYLCGLAACPLIYSLLDHLTDRSTPSHSPLCPPPCRRTCVTCMRVFVFTSDPATHICSNQEMLTVFLLTVTHVKCNSMVTKVV